MFRLERNPTWHNFIHSLYSVYYQKARFEETCGLKTVVFDDVIIPANENYTKYRK